ncbi:hypothetical protein [Lysobacter sp. A289]
MKLMFGLVLSLASATAFAQSQTPAVEAAPAEAAAPAAQAAPSSAAAAATAKAKAAKAALLIAGGVAVGAVALNSSDDGDDRPSSP